MKKMPLMLLSAVLCAMLLIVACDSNSHKPEIYTVTFDSAGGSEVETQKVEVGRYVAMPNAPVRNGYDFRGWLNDGVDFGFETTPVTSDIILKAIWSDSTKWFDVTFDSDGGSEVDSQNLKDGDKVEKPENPEKKGYYFEYWTFNGSEYDFNTRVTSDFTLKAKWTESYTIAFDSGEGTPVASQNIRKNGKVVKPENPYRDGYYFECWTINGYDYNFDALVTSDLTLVAKWAESCTIVFDSAGGSSVEAEIIKKGTTAVKPEDPTKGIDIFDGWYSNDDVKFDFDTPISENIKLTAHWKTGCKVTFKTDGGSEVTPQIVEQGTYAMKPDDPIKEGYKFAQWVKDGSTFNFDATPITSDIELYALWDNVTELCIVTFNSNGGYPSEIKKGVQLWGKVSKPEDPTKEGSYFICWMNGGTIFDFNKELIHENITLYALWSDFRIYTVSFDTAGGTTIPLQRIKEGEYAEKPSNPYKYGYEFLNWTTEEGREYSFNSPITSDMVLTAKWQLKTHQIVFDSNGGTSVNVEIVNDGGTGYRPANPKHLTDKYKTFRYWELDGNEYDFTAPVKTDLTLKAVWGDYKVCDIGPAGGFIFYDCDADNGPANDGAGPDGLKSDVCGWRFLEVAKEDLPETTNWGLHSEQGDLGTYIALGKGKQNTKNLYGRKCTVTTKVWGVEIDGYKDWFIPSREELSRVYDNIHVKGLGGFRKTDYWTSCRNNNSDYYSWTVDFTDGRCNGTPRERYTYVRPVRSF